MFLRRGLVVTLCGLAIGLAGAIALRQVLAAVLYETSPGDPMTLGAVAATLLASAVVASWLPAARAARVDPAETLRADG
jgi:ABC-type antimicrobial peptide transport system permease subunit